MAKKEGQFWAMPKTIMAMKNLSLQSRFVYAILWTRANGENRAWPGQKKIAEDLGIGERSVRRYLDELKKIGLISSERKGLGKTNSYFLTGQIGLSEEANGVLSREATAVSYHSIRKITEENNRGNGDKSPTLTELFNKEIIVEHNDYSKGEFLAYWTEKNPGGKKERWQMEKVFDIKRRWNTWLRNDKRFNKKEEPRQNGWGEKKIERFEITPEQRERNLDRLKIMKREVIEKIS